MPRANADAITAAQISLEEAAKPTLRIFRNAMTLAHRGLPFGTRVRITNLKNGRIAIARVNDRGPFVRGRIADLSQGLARNLGIGGVGRVKIEIIRPTAPAVAATPPAVSSPASGEQP